jgi:hypothetical protein
MRTKKIITVIFKENIVNAPTKTTVAGQAVDLRKRVRISKNPLVAEATITKLALADKVFVRNNLSGRISGFVCSKAL